MITVVHEPSNLGDPSPNIYEDYAPDNTNYFPIKWNDNVYHTSNDSCGNRICQVLDGDCLCDLAVIEDIVFNSAPSSFEDVITYLHTGSVAPGLDYFQDKHVDLEDSIV